MSLTDGRLRVLYNFPHRIGIPGIGTTAWHHVAQLLQAGTEVTLCCGSCERPLPGLAGLVETMKIGGQKIPYRLLGYDRAFRRHGRKAARLLAGSRDRIDVVHGWPAGSLELFQEAVHAGIPAVMERPNTHTRYAYEVVRREHEALGLPIPRNNSHFSNSRRLQREELEYSLASKIACPSDFVVRTFRENGFPDQVLARHQYGFDPDVFFPPELGHSNGEGDDRPFTVLFAGRCEPRKGLHLLLKAWHDSGLAEIGRLIICGQFVPGYREVLAEGLNHHSVEERGHSSDIASVMRQSHVLALPSIEEGSALVTYEARACGCVLLVSSAAGAVCSHMEEGLVHEPGNVSALAEQLIQLHRDRNLLQALRRTSLERLEDLTWEKGTERLLSIYRGLAPERSSHESGVA